jgi:hypothetical protein
MKSTVWKAYKSEKAAIKYASKIYQQHGVILGVEYVGGVWMVSAY